MKQTKRNTIDINELIRKLILIYHLNKFKISFFLLDLRFQETNTS